MATYNSPGNYVIEKAFSEYPPSVNSSIAGVVGFASRGPVNKAILITSASQLLRTFGTPDGTDGGQGLLGALEILTRTNSLYYVRAATDNSLDASAFIGIGVCPSLYVSGYTGATAANFNVSTKDESANNTTPLGENYYSLQVAATTGLMKGADVLAQAVDNAADLDFPFTFVLDETDADRQSGWLVGTHAGEDAQIAVSAAPSINVFYKVDASSGDAAGAVSNDVAASGGVFLPSINGGTYFIQSKYPGKGYNYSNTTNVEGTTVKGIQVEVDAKIGPRFDLKVYDSGGLEESYTMEMASGGGISPEEVIVSDVESSTSEFITALFRDSGNAHNEAWSLPDQWHEKATGTISVKYGGFTAIDATPRFLKLLKGTEGLAGGANGDVGDNAGTLGPDEKAALKGTAAGKDGMHALNVDDIDISMACVPGITHQTVQNELISLAEETQNFLAVVSPTYGMTTAQEAISWHNGRGGARTSAINSSYAAIYWPWVKSFDVYSKSDIWLDPAAFAIATMCFTDSKSDPWFAPAGLTRGRLTRPFDVEVSLNQGDRDALYQPGNSINPIAKFARDGIVIWGQKTAQRTPSALDRINVRRMMIVIRKLILASTRTFMFEPNDPLTWSKIVNVLEPAIDDIRRRRGITEFRVVCDDTTNTPVRVDRNEMWCRVLIRPTKTAETLIFEVNLTNQSADLGAI